MKHFGKTNTTKIDPLAEYSGNILHKHLRSSLDTIDNISMSVRTLMCSTGEQSTQSKNGDYHFIPTQTRDVVCMLSMAYSIMRKEFGYYNSEHVKFFDIGSGIGNILTIADIVLTPVFTTFFSFGVDKYSYKNFYIKPPYIEDMDMINLQVKDFTGAGPTKKDQIWSYMVYLYHPIQDVKKMQTGLTHVINNVPGRTLVIFKSTSSGARIERCEELLPRRYHLYTSDCVEYLTIQP